MADQLDTLKKLQTLDAELYQLRRQQEERPKELEQASATVAAEEAQLKELEARLKTLQLHQKEQEGELQTKEAHVKKLQGQLFQVKTNKEYSAMQREIDTLKADNSLLEEGILQTLDAIEQAGKARQQQQGRVTEAQQRFAQEQERITRRSRSGSPSWSGTGTGWRRASPRRPWRRMSACWKSGRGWRWSPS